MIRKDQMSDKRTDILNATLKLVSENGFHGTPTSQIAQEANVGTGTIYRYFKNKDELIDELYKHLKREMAQAVMEGYSTDLPMRDRFCHLWTNTVNYYINHPEETAFLEQYANSPYLKEDTADILAEYFQTIFEYVAHGIREGVMKDLHFEMWASLTFEVAVSLAKKHRAGTIVMDEVTIEQAVGACWDAIKR